MSQPINNEGDTPVRTLTAVLQHFDWSRTQLIPNRFEIWQPQNGQAELIVPLDPSRPDFSRLLEAAENEVFKRYGNQAKYLEELLQLSGASALDETQWEKETPVGAGLIPWNDGEDLYASARATLIAAAKSTRERKMYHGNSSAYIARQFLDQCFMGQTAIRSFVITAHTPADKRFHFSKRSEDIVSQRPREAETVSGREILETFEHSLSVVRECLDGYRLKPNTESFVEAVPEGLSYEFVKALSTVTQGADSSVQIRQHTSFNEPRSPKEYTFSAAESPILEQVAHRFAAAHDPQEVTLVGEVTLLSHVRTEPVHVIRLDIDRGSEARKARVRLTSDEYRVALEAHSNNDLLRVSGRLEREGNIHWLYEAKEIEIIPADNPQAFDEIPLF